MKSPKNHLSFETPVSHTRTSFQRAWAPTFDGVHRAEKLPGGEEVSRERGHRLSTVFIEQRNFRAAKKFPESQETCPTNLARQPSQKWWRGVQRGPLVLYVK